MTKKFVPRKKKHSGKQKSLQDMNFGDRRTYRRFLTRTKTLFDSSEEGSEHPFHMQGLWIGRTLVKAPEPMRVLAMSIEVHLTLDCGHHQARVAFTFPTKEETSWKEDVTRQSKLHSWVTNKNWASEEVKLPFTFRGDWIMIDTLEGVSNLRVVLLEVVEDWPQSRPEFVQNEAEVVT